MTLFQVSSGLISSDSYFISRQRKSDTVTAINLSQKHKQWYQAWSCWFFVNFRKFRKFENFRSVQNCDREWTEMIADDHVLNVEMPRFPNLFNISIFWHGSNANRSSLRYSYWFINPVWNQITGKIFLLVPSIFNPSDCWRGIWKTNDPLISFQLVSKPFSL